jgi:hypothetical protein
MMAAQDAQLPEPALPGHCSTTPNAPAHSAHLNRFPTVRIRDRTVSYLIRTARHGHSGTAWPPPHRLQPADGRLSTMPLLTGPVELGACQRPARPPAGTATPATRPGQDGRPRPQDDKDEERELRRADQLHAPAPPSDLSDDRDLPLAVLFHAAGCARQCGAQLGAAQQRAAQAAAAKLARQLLLRRVALALFWRFFRTCSCWQAAGAREPPVSRGLFASRARPRR